MRKIIAGLTILAIVLLCAPATLGTEQDVSFSEIENIGICETADECVDNITVGWNLGCSLSAYSKETIDAWGVMVYFLTPDRLYSRSEIAAFDPVTKTAEITWVLGQDNGVLQTYDGAVIDEIGIELHNYGLGSNDFLTYTVSELWYSTTEGQVSVQTTDGSFQTDMSSGTGGGIVADVNEPLIGTVEGIHAKITFVEQTSGPSTAETIAQAEMAWGNSVTTQAMINAVRDRGFNMIRVQVSWLNHMDEEGNIDPLWLERVTEVVDYCMDAGVYCLLNTSGGGWLTAESETYAEQSAIYANLWEQIAENFADYGELLLFESCNEVLNADGCWWNPPVEVYGVMNDLYQVFVDTVRAAGGYNATRNLVLNPYAATYNYEMNSYFELPEDTVEGHLIAQVHCYVPVTFCANETNLGSATFVNEWGTDAEKAELDTLMENVKTRFIDELGIPVIVGEFGTVKRVPEEERAEYCGFYVQTAEKYGIKTVVFDDGGDFAIFDRNTLSWPYEQIVDALLQNSAEENTIPGWSVMAYFTGSDDSYNRSTTMSFNNDSKAANIVWELAADDSIITADNDACIDGVGIELWNFDLTENDIITYRIEELKYITQDGNVVNCGVTGVYGTDMSDGTGGGLLVQFDNLAVTDIHSVVMKVTFVEHMEIPVSVPTTNPKSDWSVMAYFTGSDGSYNRSEIYSFDNDTNTAEIVWRLGDDNGIINAGSTAEIDCIGIEFWNFNLTQDDIITYRIDELRYISSNNQTVVDSVAGQHGTNMSDGTGGGVLVDTEGLTVAETRAIIAKVTFVELVEIPAAVPVTNPMPGWSAVAYFAGADGSYNRSDVFVFDNETKTAEIVWLVGEDNGIINASDSASVVGIGIELWNFSLTQDDEIQYRVDSFKYITTDQQVAVDLGAGEYVTDMSDGTGGGLLVNIDNLLISNLRAIVIEISLAQQGKS